MQSIECFLSRWLVRSKAKHARGKLCDLHEKLAIAKIEQKEAIA
jgi:hypothetical protein